MPREADDRHLDLARLSQMQVLPTVHLNALSLGIDALPMARRRAMRARLVAGKVSSIFAWSSALSRRRGSGSREDAPTLGAQELGTRQICGRAQKRRVGIGAICRKPRTQPLRQVGHTLAQLDSPHLPSRVLRVNAPVVQDVAPATARIRPDP